MAVDSSGSGTAVITSAALALSKQARQGVSEQVEQIINSPKESEEQQQLKPVEDGKESEKANDQQQSAGKPSGGPAVPERGHTVNIKG